MSIQPIGLIGQDAGDDTVNSSSTSIMTSCWVSSMTKVAFTYHMVPMPFNGHVGPVKTNRNVVYVEG